ncbi:MAG: glutamine--tRNA ligase/YqeY domain fusion protein [Lentisphaeria bacterium]|nr:glutamine--tRNA ligase/YqeY domain fusion protein [Lentisphaeria bacterium]
MSEEILNEKPLDFIREIVAEDIKNNKYPDGIVTRFPPEPNGYLHIGHAKAICLDFGVAEENNGICHLRMDDTNPTKEDMEYVESIIEDVKWLGFDPSHLYYASDYFEDMYNCAVKLIKKGLAYVCSLTPEEFEEYRGNSERVGRDTPGRSQSIEENLDLFERMRAGEFEDGSKVLRARIDMTSPNIHMRDPVIYRIRRIDHFRQGNKWCIYPMYDFAHCLEDAFEGVTHSFCTLEFEIHRPLYDWVLDNLDFKVRPYQHEFSRLSLSHTVMSKRKLLQLVKENYVRNWDDPRMPTICGMRRRGVTAAALRNFAKGLGITKFNGLTDMAVLEHCIREDLNKKASRYLAVLNPLKVTITNMADDFVDYLDGVNNPEDESAGTRKIPFTKHLYIEKTDFMVEPVKGYFRLAPGKEVRLRYAYFIKCEEFVTDENGEVIELKCTYDPETRGGNAPDGRKVKGTIHWVSADYCKEAEVRLYDRLFTVEQPGMGEEDFLTQLNPDSEKVASCYIEPALAEIKPYEVVQFERVGYFACDKDSTDEKRVFNRTVTLKDSWAKKQ